MTQDRSGSGRGGSASDSETPNLVTREELERMLDQKIQANFDKVKDNLANQIARQVANSLNSQPAARQTSSPHQPGLEAVGITPEEYNLADAATQKLAGLVPAVSSLATEAQMRRMHNQLKATVSQYASELGVSDLLQSPSWDWKEDLVSTDPSSIAERESALRSQLGHAVQEKINKQPGTATPSAAEIQSAVNQQLAGLGIYGVDVSALAAIPSDKVDALDTLNGRFSRQEIDLPTFEKEQAKILARGV